MGVNARSGQRVYHPKRMRLPECCTYYDPREGGRIACVWVSNARGEASSVEIYIRPGRGPPPRKRGAPRPRRVGTRSGEAC
ncbi:hypothetical protein R1flu_000233 [Riccia fluitans]|uniref:Uncharacterized protein n=1 Tax=Riccia fluitans TaxID=41844 RepID=A0ABD1Y018_9MARC